MAESEKQNAFGLLVCKCEKTPFFSFLENGKEKNDILFYLMSAEQVKPAVKRI